MKALLDAIILKFDATAALTTAFPGGIHHGRAPKGETRPFVVVRVVTAPADPTYGAAHLGDVVIDFIGWTGTGENLVSAATLIAAMEVLGATYEAGLTVTNATVTNVTTTDVLPILVPEEEEMGADVWQANVQATFSVTTT